MAIHTNITAAARIVDAIAEHGEGAIGGMPPIRPCTTITLRRTWAKGGEFIATLAGHLSDGEIVQFPGESCAYRLHLAEAV